MRSLESDIVSGGCFIISSSQVFNLKGGGTSNMYINMRNSLGNPKLFDRLTREISLKIDNSSNINVCGVPDGGVPFASVAGFLSKNPVLIVRKTEKKHGLGGLVFGGSNENKDCVLIDDVISTGTSLIEAVDILRKEGYTVKRAIVIVNREMGGVDNLKKNGIDVEYITTATKIEKGIFDPENKFNLHSIRKKCKNYAANRLVECAFRKKSNIILSADLCTSSSLIDLIEKVGDHVCCVKIHSDAVSDFNKLTVERLISISKKKDFMLMEDRKLADIGSTMEKQLLNGPTSILEWADLITAHCIPGDESISHLEKIIGKNKGLVLIGEMSSKNNLIDGIYTREVIRIANVHNELIAGIVCQQALTSSPLIHMCPGIRRVGKEDGAGQNYRVPKEALDDGISMLIIGRDIYNSENPKRVAEEYQKECWTEFI